jgi:ATP-binding cassette subfamily C protein LapB
MNHEHPSASFASESSRIAAINAIIGETRLAGSPLARCIAPLLVALNWLGSPRRLLAGLPSKDTALGVDGLAGLLGSQGLRLRQLRWAEWSGRFDTLPTGSMVETAGQARVYLGRRDNQEWWHNGEMVLQCAEPGPADTLLLIEPDPTFQPIDAPQTGWLGRLMMVARREIGGVLVVSLAANLLALALSLFTMFVYNMVIPSGAIGTLWSMAAGATLGVIGAWGLRMVRVSLVSRLTGWAGTHINHVAMGKTLGLPLEVSARLGIENNLIRLRTLESTRQWFSGASGAVNADYPFIVIFLVVIALLGGWIVFVPLIGLMLFALISWPLATMLNARANAVSLVSRRFGEMISVLTSRLRALRGVPGTGLWNRQISDLVAQSVALNREYALANALTQTVGQALSMLVVLATMGVGIALVLAQDMSTGGLIATMMLIWRVTTPAQQFFASQVRVKQLVDSTHQLDRLLSTPGEASNPQLTSTVTSLSPAVEADRLYHRYSADREPSLAGISFKLEPGQMLAVVGPNGAGKSSLLEVLAGIRPAQNGRVRIGGRDIRQFDPVDYRSWHGYLPQQIPALPITVREAMSLRRPASTDRELSDALCRVAGEQWWQFFKASSAAAALDVSIAPSREDREATRGRFIVRLAASVLGDPPLVLLDDPLGDRDPALDPHLMVLLDSLRGQSTVVLATHRPDLIQRCDLVAVLNDGQLAHFGPVATPESVAAPAKV